eukprot:5074111-Prymnesium_polylepis.1
MACSTEDLKTTPTFPVIRAICTGRICKSTHPSSRDARQYGVEVGKPIPAHLAGPPPQGHHARKRQKNPQLIPSTPTPYTTHGFRPTNQPRATPPTANIKRWTSTST